jgi:hypothetical protein
MNAENQIWNSRDWYVSIDPIISPTSARIRNIIITPLFL